MSSRQVWLWGVLALACVGTTLAGITSSYAGNIAVNIDGQQLTWTSYTDCDNQTKCFNIAGSYDVLTVAPVSVGSGRGAYARVEFPESLTDLTHDSLQIINAKITNTGGADKTFTVIFEQEDVQQPSNTKYYNTYLNGNFGAVAGNSITSKSYYKVSGGNYAQVGSTLSHTVNCPSTCSTAFSKKTGIQKPGTTSPRWVKIELTITLKAGSYVDLNSGAQIITSGNPPDLSAINLVDGPTLPCDGCVPSSQLSVLCSTTYSTAKMFGCPSCVTEDGQVASHAKVKLFASTNWDNLSQDMARGQGEHLAALAALLQVPAAEQPAFFALAQERYSALGQSDRVSPDDMIADLRAQMAIRTPLASVSAPPGG